MFLVESMQICFQSMEWPPVDQRDIVDIGYLLDDILEGIVGMWWKSHPLLKIWFGMSTLLFSNQKDLVFNNQWKFFAGFFLHQWWWSTVKSRSKEAEQRINKLEWKASKARSGKVNTSSCRYISVIKLEKRLDNSYKNFVSLSMIY